MVCEIACFQQYRLAGEAVVEMMSYVVSEKYHTAIATQLMVGVGDTAIVVQLMVEVVDDRATATRLMVVALGSNFHVAVP